ncbi:MAG: 4Fe-4S binding protein, partial [Victivallales bacterium]|nr:4Fe-4S binding protein [Victivallales bacterium]
ETKSFFQRVVDGGLLKQWDGLTPAEAVAKKVDAVSGATFSSEGVIGNVQAAMKAEAAKVPAVAEPAPSTETVPVVQEKISEPVAGEPRPSRPFPWQLVAGVLVALFSAFGPLFWKDKRVRMFQMGLNVLVLGFWCGTFLSWTLFVNYVSNGISLSARNVVPVLLLAVAILFPFFGRKSHYCTQLCPYGSLQELLGHASRKKLTLSSKVLQTLNWTRRILWALLMLFAWCGLLFQWMDYEPFTAFLFRSAAPVAIGIAIAFALLSVWIPRPYCRFVCPTGTLLKISQG